MNVVGDVSGQTCIIQDDIIDTAGTIVKAAAALKANGARSAKRGPGSASSRTLIFDEVDAGIGGGVAEIVGRQLRDLAARGQVLCVTHLAQVASQAHHQLRVSKLTDGRSSRTSVTSLGPDERIEELARMLGGVEITRKARDHAREMLRTAG